jgi:hypothetical protein
MSQNFSLNVNDTDYNVDADPEMRSLKALISGMRMMINSLIRPHVRWPNRKAWWPHSKEVNRRAGGVFHATRPSIRSPHLGVCNDCDWVIPIDWFDPCAGRFVWTALVPGQGAPASEIPWHLSFDNHGVFGVDATLL